jgi:uncharacterized membrane protein YeiH
LWVHKPAHLLTCVLVACAAFFVVHSVQSLLRILIWCDAVGLARFSVTGAEIALSKGVSPANAIVMGVATATMGGVIHDILGVEIPIILRREIYVTAALLGALVFMGGVQFGLAKDMSLVAGFVAALALRSASIALDLSLQVFNRTDSSGNS